MKNVLTGIATSTVVMAATFLALSASDNKAWASLEFCNQTSEKVSVAIAYVQKDPEGTTTNQHQGVNVQGWWGVEPNQCKRVSSIHVGNHWTYFYAHNTRGGVWQGNARLCVPSSRFTVGSQFRRHGDACEGGSRLVGFQRLDTQAKNFKMTLN
jgi:uncharacterized membrane protein